MQLTAKGITHITTLCANVVRGATDGVDGCAAVTSFEGGVPLRKQLFESNLLGGGQLFEINLLGGGRSGFLFDNCWGEGGIGRLGDYKGSLNRRHVGFFGQCDKIRRTRGGGAVRTCCQYYR